MWWITTLGQYFNQLYTMINHNYLITLEWKMFLLR